MTYEAFENRISAYLDGEMDSVERAAIEKKAAECEKSRALLQDMKALKEKLGKLPKAQPSAEFNFKLRSHLLMEVAKEGRASHRVKTVFFGSVGRTITTVAAAVLLGLGLFDLAQNDGVVPVETVVNETEFHLTPAQPAQQAQAVDHQGALQRLSEQSLRLDSRLYRNVHDSGRIDSVNWRMPQKSPWLRDQNVQQVPVSF